VEKGKEGDEVQDPRKQGAEPTFGKQKRIEKPGLEEEMKPKCDHGEESYKGAGKCKDMAVIITGGDSGIGRAAAIAFAREGADVLINYLPVEEEDAAETARWVEDAGRQCVRHPGDITSEKECERIVQDAVKKFGKLDVLVCNAAYQNSHEKLDHWSSEEWDRTFKTNIYAMFWLCKAAIPHMKPGASIITVGSIQSFNPTTELLAYATTKGAIANFTKGLAGYAMEKGIRVNCVAPGPVWTPLIPSTLPMEKVKHFGDDTLFGRPAQPAEIAPLFTFLSSNDARYITGEIYMITGGKSPL